MWVLRFAQDDNLFFSERCGSEILWLEDVTGLPGLFAGFGFGGFVDCGNDADGLSVGVELDEAEASAAQAAFKAGPNVGDGEGRVADEPDAAV